MARLKGDAGQPRHAPGPRGHRLIGSLLEIRRDRLSFVRRMTRDYGDIVACRMGFKTIYIISHPDYVRHVLHENHQNYKKGLGLTEAKPLLGEGLLTSEGDLWASQRRLLQGAFRREKLARHGAAITAATSAMLARWGEHAETGRHLDVSEEMRNLTLQILGDTLFETDLSGSMEEVTAHLGLLSRWAMRRTSALIKPPLSVPTMANVRARKALHQLGVLAARIEREIWTKDAEQYDGLFRACLPLRREDKDTLRASHGAAVGVPPRGTANQIRDEIMTFLLAGHETTAAALAWTWYLLSVHPDVEARLHEELSEVLTDRVSIIAAWPRLVYAKMIVDEVLRLYPPVWLIPRRALGPDRIGGYVVPADCDVLVSVYSLHRHPDVWESPDSFQPERFRPERSGMRPAYSYLPFGLGPRSCVGSSLALMEMLLVVATVAREYRLQLLPSYTVDAEPLLTLRPLNGVPVILRKREPSRA